MLLLPDINTVGGRLGTVLCVAVFVEEDIVRLLLDRGADANVMGSRYKTVLGAAASRPANEVAAGPRGRF